MRVPIAKRIGVRLQTAPASAPGRRAIIARSLAVALAASLCACAITMPIASLVTPASHDDIAGSIERPPLARVLDDEDLRRAEAALATALDPRANGALVAWENPQSGAKGSFTPHGTAYPDDAKICRGFRGEIDRKGATRILRGTACADKAGEWTIAEIDPSRLSPALD